MNDLDFDLDALIDQSVIEGQLAAGISPEVLSARNPDQVNVVAALFNSGNFIPRQPSSVWMPEEDAFLNRSLGRLSIEEIARRLGRSPAAVKVRWTRQGMTAPSKRDGEIVATQLGSELGWCGKKVIRMIDEGRLPGRVLPGDRNIHVVEEKHLLRWLVQPANFVYITDTKRIKNRRYRALVERAMARWGDEWIGVGEVARMKGCSGHAINKAIREGRLPAFRWQNWRVLRSDAEKLNIHPGSGGWMRDWSRQCDAFMLLAGAIGLPYSFIDYLTGNDMDSRYRTTWLCDRGLDAPIRRQFDIPTPLADWRDYQSRFPGVVRAVKKFLARQRPLSLRDAVVVRGLMYAWLDAYGTDYDEELANGLRYGAGIAGPHIVYGYYDRLLEMGIDPFAGV